jgi:Ca2+-binding EF-hand superfamily protein
VQYKSSGKDSQLLIRIYPLTSSTKMETARMNQELQQECNRKLKAGGLSPLEKLRCACLKRGVTGIISMGRTFRIFDDSGNKSLDLEEFTEGVHDYKAVLADNEIIELFHYFDKDGTGSIDFDEFLFNLRPPMSQRRLDLIDLAFSKMDKTGDGVITSDDLRGVYNVKQHAKYMSGEWTEKQCYNAFLDTFDTGKKDGIVMKKEFINYYAGVSASVDTDAYFDLMMRQAWKL